MIKSKERKRSSDFIATSLSSMPANKKSQRPLLIIEKGDIMLRDVKAMLIDFLRLLSSVYCTKKLAMP
jgi:hypothetical protein